MPEFGPTEIGCEPDITRLTAEPMLASVPAVGLSLITLPAGTVLLVAVVMVPTSRPTPVSVDAAFAWVIFTTFGTATCVGGTVKENPFDEIPAPLTINE